MTSATSPYFQRRQKVLSRLGSGVLVLPAALAAKRNGDAEYPYRQASDFLYLTGFDEPESVVVLNPASPKPFTLFVRPRDREMEIWNGRRAGLEGAVRDFGADQAFLVDELDEKLPDLLLGAPAIYAPLGVDPDFDARLIGHLVATRRRGRTGQMVPDRLVDLSSLVHELRLFKDESELELLRKAVVASEEGHRRAMAVTGPGVFEYELEAELLHAYRRHGGAGPGYEPIVAAGVNSTILHYRTGHQALADGELVLIDSGCEFQGYTADVTRTWPVNGRFSSAQKQLYETVLQAHEAAIAATRPGVTLDHLHELATRILIEGALDAGLLSGSVESCLKDQSYRRYYMHRTSHWLGLDVHDVGAYAQGGSPRPLAPGMVFTIEPGLYVPEDDEQAGGAFRGIGIRIEDNVLVTADGCEVLTAGIPRSVAEVEAAVGVGESGT